MSARVFISYRSSDGADKATALARDLDDLFGDEQIFLDKDDLAGGSRWREVIRHALSARPVLLVLVTPHYLEARDAEGRRRIELADDPVRNELADAIAADATLIPILCDGLAEVPNVARLPAPLNELGERTWRRLRTYDWRNDVARLAGDLRLLGLQGRTGGEAADGSPGAPGLSGQAASTVWPSAAGAAAPSTAPADFAAAPALPQPAPAAAPRRRLLLALGGLVVAGAAGGGWWWSQRHDPADLAGDWSAVLGDRGAPNAAAGVRIRFRIEQEDARMRVVSTPVEIDRDPAWADYRRFWKENKGHELMRVVYRGEGTLRLDPGQPGALEVPIRIEAAASQEPVDGGHLSLTVDERGRRMHGTLWLNSEQADRIIELRRGGSP